MTLRRSLLAIAALFGLLPVGCTLGDTGADVMDIDAVGFETQDDPSGGQNGLVNVDFHAHKYELLAALRLPIYPRYSTAPSALNSGILNTAGGRNAFGYAVRCAIPKGTTITHNGYQYHGGGLLDTASGWLYEALLQPAQEDVFACILAHLNPSGQHVDIALMGPSVVDDPTFDAAQFSFKEALWGAEISTTCSSGVCTDVLTFHAWPLEDLSQECSDPVITNEEILTRICPNDPNNLCELTIHANLASCIETSPGVYTTCNGRPVVQTRLDPYNTPPFLGCFTSPPGCGSTGCGGTGPQ